MQDSLKQWRRGGSSAAVQDVMIKAGARRIMKALVLWFFNSSGMLVPSSLFHSFFDQGSAYCSLTHSWDVVYVVFECSFTVRMLRCNYWTSCWGRCRVLSFTGTKSFFRWFARLYRHSCKHQCHHHRSWNVNWCSYSSECLCLTTALVMRRCSCSCPSCTAMMLHWM